MIKYIKNNILKICGVLIILSSISRMITQQPVSAFGYGIFGILTGVFMFTVGAVNKTK